RVPQPGPGASAVRAAAVAALPTAAPAAPQRGPGHRPRPAPRPGTPRGTGEGARCISGHDWRRQPRSIPRLGGRRHWDVCRVAMNTTAAPQGWKVASLTKDRPPAAPTIPVDDPRSQALAAGPCRLAGRWALRWPG